MLFRTFSPRSHLHCQMHSWLTTMLGISKFKRKKGEQWDLKGEEEAFKPTAFQICCSIMTVLSISCLLSKLSEKDSQTF